MAQMKIKNRIRPFLTFVFLLCFHVGQPLLGGLEEDMAANIVRHFLAQKGQRLLVEAMLGAPFDQAGQTIVPAVQKGGKGLLETFAQQAEKQAVQIGSADRDLLDASGDILEIFLQAIDLAKSQMI